GVGESRRPGLAPPQRSPGNVVIRYFLTATVAHCRKAPSLFFLTVLGVSLGVASVLAIQIINRNAIGAFSAAITAISGEADLSVLGQATTFSEDLYPQVLGVEGVAAAWPLYQVDVALADRDLFFLEIYGVDLFSPIRPPWSSTPENLSDALFQLGWVAVTPSLAQEMGWSPGNLIRVSSGTRRVELVIGALVDFQRVSPLASRKLAVMDIAQVQGLLGTRGRIHQIDVQMQEGTNREELMARLQERLGPSVQIVTPEQREKQAADLMGAFRLNLTALSLISLFVGLFLVYTSTQASLLRRRLEFGLLRSMGATAGQVFGLILGEVILLGILGVLLGLPLGYWVAKGNVEMVSSTLTNLYLLQEIDSLRLSFSLYVLAACVGIGGAIVGAVLPAIDMSRRDSKSLLTVFTLHERAGSASFPLFLLGWLLLALTALWFWLLGQSWKPAGFILAVAVLISFPLLTPFLIKKSCEKIRVESFSLAYSLRSLSSRLQTTSFAASSLAIAVSMLVGISLMIGSFRQTVALWVETTVQADVYITTPSWRADPEATMDEELISSLAAHPGVTSVDRLRRILVSNGEKRISMAGVDMQLAKAGQSRFPLFKGDRLLVLQQVKEQEAVLIAEPLARKSRLDVGDHLVLYGPQGREEFPIAGIYYDYSSEVGSAAMDLATMNQHFGPGPINTLSLYLEEDREPQQVIDEIKARFPDIPLRIRSNRHLREEIFEIFDQTFSVVRILQVMCLLIAVCGIMLTLLVLASERISELALYRALGADRVQIFRVFVGKGLGMGLIGLSLGTIGGVVLAAILIFIINRTYFGWTIQVYWPGWPLVQQFAAILTAALLASLYPAFRASRTPATELSRDDL
ncbi:ABC transporter permease, partial [Acidobacteria bacterium AH-259-D05]|nr:ABC transporter permease [Acidobacteria bacterium AH-259-D05]